jgi:hypothetical protein
VQLQYFHAKSSRSPGKYNSSPLPFIPFPLSLDTRKSNTFNQQETRNANGESLNQILIGRRVLESSKQKLDAG